MIYILIEKKWAFGHKPIFHKPENPANRCGTRLSGFLPSLKKCVFYAHFAFLKVGKTHKKWAFFSVFDHFSHCFTTFRIFVIFGQYSKSNILHPEILQNPHYARVLPGFKNQKWARKLRKMTKQKSLSNLAIPAQSFNRLSPILQEIL